MTRVKKTSTHFENKTTLAAGCPEVHAAGIIGGQWTLAICCYLINGKLRYSELRKCLPHITERMLSLQLRKLEQQGIIGRTLFAEVPPRVEYELTPIGYQLGNVIKELGLWGKAHQRLMEPGT